MGNTCHVKHIQVYRLYSQHLAISLKDSSMNKLYNFIRKMYVCIQFTFKMYIIYTQKNFLCLWVTWLGYMINIRILMALYTIVQVYSLLHKQSAHGSRLGLLRIGQARLDWMIACTNAAAKPGKTGNETVFLSFVTDFCGPTQKPRSATTVKPTNCEPTLPAKTGLSSFVTVVFFGPPDTKIQKYNHQCILKAQSRERVFHLWSSRWFLLNIPNKSRRSEGDSIFDKYFVRG